MSALLNLTKNPGPAPVDGDGTRAGGGAGKGGDPGKGAGAPGNATAGVGKGAAGTIGAGGGMAGAGGAGEAGTEDSALSVPGTAGMEGAVISAGTTGGVDSSAMPGFAANSAAAKKIHPMRFIRFLPVPLSSFIAFPGCSAAPRPAACRAAKEPVRRPGPWEWGVAASNDAKGEMPAEAGLSAGGRPMPTRGGKDAGQVPVVRHRGGSSPYGPRLPRRSAPRRRAAKGTPGHPPSTAVRPSRPPSP